jgi:hypothetical protein
MVEREVPKSEERDREEREMVKKEGGGRSVKKRRKNFGPKEKLWGKFQSK